MVKLPQGQAIRLLKLLQSLNIGLDYKEYRNLYFAALVGESKLNKQKTSQKFVTLKSQNLDRR